MNNLSFDINSSKDFLNKLIEDFKDYLKSDNSSRMALNCAMTSWHLSEWVFHEYELGGQFSKIKDFQKHLKELCPSLQIMHDISNGSKHYKLNTHKPKVKETERKTGTFDKTFDFSFDRTMLKIVMPNNQIAVFDEELEKTIAFWKEFMNNLDS
ncbi:hypothetical protein [Flagellimonas zhangzhouensis]|uniref:Uncharacterized protein n=1 Tax=Flagellimonas zhangzhouensis TaxID=1073328 RepID=A0A1H2WP72_9FLAO|nr:hypothetical protein [Allomuricauda zhangzhouensis]SDQ23324.1 hypothetical protein SAMN05216294_0991 [Allomuricauda zhangzhouensis]SDW82432.1 hypothetical protein SAMN04487892_2371 [Allomuricauda zhangzhouensis]